MLKKELDHDGLQDFFWSDSKVVLGFINNESQRFQAYVANREQFICDHTSPDQWPYVESGSNPADEASRGMNAKEVMQKSQWIRAQISCGRQKITGLNKTRTKMRSITILLTLERSPLT